MSELAGTYYIQIAFKPEEQLEPSRLQKSFLNGHGEIVLLPPAYQLEFNSRHPYGWGNGSMITNKGLQHVLSAGLFGKLGPLQIQLRPDWIYAQNRDFESFPPSTSAAIQQARYYHWLTSDPPEKFGNSSYTNLNMGQSSAYLNFGAFHLGASTENLWWGAGQFNSLIFSNNSRGFEHVTLGTYRPLNTVIGSFEAQLVAGKLNPIDVLPIYANGVSISKNTDWRYLSALMFTYNPKWINGLFLGFARTFQQYHGDLTPSFGGYFPVFEAFQKETVGLSVDSKNQDQQIAIFTRWLFPKANAEIYFEFGRRDHALNWRDFVMSPEHARAFLFGFSKLLRLQQSEFIQIRFEMTQSQQSVNQLLRTSAEGGTSWGTHIPVLAGFSHYGQQLGNGVGPGNNVQTFEVSWVKDLRKVGIMFERLEHQMDFYNSAFRDNSPARPWVDLSTGLVGNWRFNRLVANAKVQFIKSLNYQWQQTDIFPGGQNAKGVDRFNLHSYMGVSYVF